MNTVPLLTIAIPTYDRGQSLEQRLIEIRAQADESVRVLVSDNCSSDSTEAVVRAYQPTMPYLHYHRNSVNIGFDKNILTLYRLADTRYIWFLSDDDAVLDNAIQFVLEACRKYEPVVAVFNSTSTDASGVPLVARSIPDMVYDSLQDLPDPTIVLNAIFVSALVVERQPDLDTSRWDEAANTNFFQVTLVLLLLSHRFRFCLLSAIVVRRHVGPPYYLHPDLLQFMYIGVYEAVNVPGHIFEIKPFKDRSIHSFELLKLLALEKAGLYRFSKPMRREWLKRIHDLYGSASFRADVSLLLYDLVPCRVVKSIYWLRMIQKHGWRQGRLMYRRQTTRA
jgi:glycosyltransferase involved in cell wall biosynthesis